MNVVQQRGFIVVNVIYDGYNWCVWFSCSICVMVVYYCFFQFVFMMQDNFMVYFFSNQLCGFLIDNLVDGCYCVQFYYCFDDLRVFNCYFVCQFVNGDSFVDYNVMVNGLSRFLEVLLQ